MTLRDFINKWPYLITINDGGSAHTPDAINCRDRWQLWCLTDYRVSSVIAGTIWLRRVED